MDAFERGMRCLSNIGGALAAAVVIVITALCILEIVLRSLFNTPTYLQEEFTGYGLALIAFLGLGRTFFDGVIIRVNLLRDRFPRRLLAKNGTTHLLPTSRKRTIDNIEIMEKSGVKVADASAALSSHMRNAGADLVAEWKAKVGVEPASTMDRYLGR